VFCTSAPYNAKVEAIFPATFLAVFSVWKSSNWGNHDNRLVKISTQLGTVPSVEKIAMHGLQFP